MGPRLSGELGIGKDAGTGFMLKTLMPGSRISVFKPAGGDALLQMRDRERLGRGFAISVRPFSKRYLYAGVPLEEEIARLNRRTA